MIDSHLHCSLLSNKFTTTTFIQCRHPHCHCQHRRLRCQPLALCDSRSWSTCRLQCMADQLCCRSIGQRCSPSYTHTRDQFQKFCWCRLLVHPVYLDLLLLYPPTMAMRRRHNRFGLQRAAPNSSLVVGTQCVLPQGISGWWQLRALSSFQAKKLIPEVIYPSMRC